MTEDDTTQTTLGKATDSESSATESNVAETDSLPLRQRRMLGETFQGDRDIYQTLGYDENLTTEEYWNGISGRTSPA